MRLSQITVAKVEDWLFSKIEVEGKAPKTANNCLSNLSVMLGEACRRGLIKENPCDKVKPLKPRCKPRGILTTEEVQKLFASLDNWDGDIVAYAGNLVGACTGMRSREVAALRGMNLKADHLEIAQSYDEMFGMKSTKTHDFRALPLPSKVLDVLHTLKRGDDDFLFTLNGKKPVNQHFFLYALYDAMEKIGISKDERKQRNIVFHSWRHFMNSQLLANNISEIKTQKITGHKTKEMTMHYAHFNAKDFQDVLEVTSEIIP
jgi:integrase